MKKTFNLAALFCFSILSVSAQFSGAGSGEEDDPYLIQNALQLNQLRNFLNQEGVYFKLVNDIDLTDFIEDENPTQGWLPVGVSESSRFMGVLDGNNKTISSLWIRRNESNNIGLFGYAEKATVKNLHVNADIEGYSYVGTLFGYCMNTNIIACAINGEVKSKGESGGGFIGKGKNITIDRCDFNGIINYSLMGCAGGFIGSGINIRLSNSTCSAEIFRIGEEMNCAPDFQGGFIGVMNQETGMGQITNCTFRGIIQGKYGVGGICGDYSSTFNNGSFKIKKCNVYANISGTGEIGGICGHFTGSKTDSITQCGFVGNIQGNSLIGGITGSYAAIMTECFAYAKLQGINKVGGLVGDMHSIDNKITNNAFYGSVNAKNHAGGLGGVITLTDDYLKDHASHLTNSISNGKVTGEDFVGGLVGGIIGYGKLLSCVSLNDSIISSTKENTGRITGYYTNKGIIGATGTTEENKSYNKTIVIKNNKQITGIQDDLYNGTGASLNTLSLKATYESMGWDFNNVWDIKDGEGIPYLKNNTLMAEYIAGKLDKYFNFEEGDENDDESGGDDTPDQPEEQSIEVTDISTLNNVIYIDKTEGFADQQLTLSLQMKNSAPIRGFQFDLYLPEGVTAVKNNKGRIQAALSSGRLPEDEEHTLTVSEQSDGAIRFLCGSQYDETFTGTDGEIATLIVKIAEDMEDGDYPVSLKTIKLTETDISKFYETELVKTTLTISSYLTGDINGDNKVDVSDYIGVANHIMGNTPVGFNIKAADVDGSGTIDVSDYIGIANLIMTGSIYGSNNIKAFIVNTLEAQ